MTTLFYFQSPSGLYFRKTPGGLVADAPSRVEADLFAEDCALFAPEAIKEEPTKLEFMRWIAKQGGSKSSRKKAFAARRRQLAIWKQRRKENWVEKRAKLKETNEKT